MNIASSTLMDILHFIKCFLFIIPLIISLRIEEQWRNNKIIFKLNLWNNTSFGALTAAAITHPTKTIFYK